MLATVVPVQPSNLAPTTTLVWVFDLGFVMPSVFVTGDCIGQPAETMRFPATIGAVGLLGPASVVPTNTAVAKIALTDLRRSLLFIGFFVEFQIQGSLGICRALRVSREFNAAQRKNPQNFLPIAPRGHPS